MFDIYRGIVRYTISKEEDEEMEDTKIYLSKSPKY
jgi:hypothetical protein